MSGHDTPPTPARAGLTIPEPSPASDDEALDLSGIVPQPKPKMTTAEVTAVTESSGFRSRMPQEPHTQEPNSRVARAPVPAPPPAAVDLPAPRRRQARSANVHQFNGRISREVLARIVNYCDQQRLSNGEFLERAIANLEESAVKGR